MRAIKIDVEGAELEVLRGANRTLERDLPVLFLEYHAAAWERAGVTMEDLRNVLVAGYGDTLQRLPYGTDTLHDVEATPPAARRRWPAWRRPRSGG